MFVYIIDEVRSHFSIGNSTSCRRRCIVDALREGLRYEVKLAELLGRQLSHHRVTARGRRAVGPTSTRRRRRSGPPCDREGRRRLEVLETPGDSDTRGRREQHKRRQHRAQHRVTTTL